MTVHQGLLYLASHPDLVGRDLRVFLALRSYCDRSGYVPILQKDLAETLHISLQEVSSGVVQLRNIGVLTRHHFHKRGMGSLYIHPDYL